MSFLAPLYIAGMLAISLPILFHLIRRTPQGRQTFSSLMFLAPSPPRLTRRSRLNNILLLILRGLALALLAFAFARPLFYSQSDLNISETEGRRIALLVDTSASMRRGDLWTQAGNRVDKVLDDLAPTDEVALFAFDEQVRPLLSFDEWNEQPQSQRPALLRSRLATISPSWAATNLGEALATVADALNDHSSQSAPSARRQLLLISDLQQGSHIEPLQGYEWPKGVLLDVQSVTLKDPTNAGLYVVQSTADAQDNTNDRVPVRVSNEADSTREQFSLAWADKNGPAPSSEPVKVYVPPGQSRIVRVPWPAKGEDADRLLLSGDSHDFDNTLYVIPPRQEQVRLVFVGDEAPDDAQGSLYYLAGAITETPRRKVEVIQHSAKQDLSGVDLLDAKLVVLTSSPPDGQIPVLHQFIEQGGTVLLVLKDASAQPGVAKLINDESLTIDEATGREYALLANIKYDHPLFAPFSDPRFADFTRIHFWKHRRLKLATSENVQVLAAFDDGSPFLLEKSIGKGRLLLATSGWQPADSQLALSTKFVPLIAGMFPQSANDLEKSQRYVLDKISLTPPTENQNRVVHRPDGSELELPADATTFDAAEPGIYRISADTTVTNVAVNLRADESRTAPFAIEELERRGAEIGTQPTVAQLAERQRQARIFELENRQKLWRWIIIAVLGVLILETVLAGRLAHRTLQPQVAS